MPAFQYQAIDADGRTHKGLLEGDTARHVRQLIRERALIPVEVTEVAGQARRSGPQRWRGRLGNAELALLTRQLATLVGSALPVEQALATLAQQAGSQRAHSLLLAVRARVLEGHSLAAAFAEFPEIFPDIYRATVAAGEQSGRLDMVLERLADYTETRQQSRQKIGLALLYPLLLTGVAILIVIGLLTYVVPQVVQVFTSVRRELPWLTRALIASSAFLRDHGVLLLATGAIGGLAWFAALKRTGLRLRLHRLALRLPLIGRIVRGVNSARFTRTLAILLASGVPALDALRIAAAVLGNLPMRAAVEQAAVEVKEGNSLHAALAASGHFPPLLLQLTASGEASGKLAAMLERAALQQERETEMLTAALLGVFEPLLILVMGAVVLMIVLAILLPIFDLNQMVR